MICGSFGSISCYFIVAHAILNTLRGRKIKMCRGNFSFKWIFICCVRIVRIRVNLSTYSQAICVHTCATKHRATLGVLVNITFQNLSCSHAMNWAYGLCCSAQLWKYIIIFYSNSVLCASRYASLPLETFDSKTIARRLLDYWYMHCIRITYIDR